MHSQPRRPLLLVAEDDPCLRQLMCTALRRGDDYAVVELGDGLELVEWLRQSEQRDEVPALIVSDICMPTMSGLEALREIRSWGSTIPVILVTALGSDDALDQAFRLGATAVLIKPLELDDLRIAVDCFMRPQGES